MVKTYLIRSSNNAGFVSRINEFIKDRCIIDIKYQTTLVNTEYSNGVPTSGRCVDSALIIYAEDNYDNESV